MQCPACKNQLQQISLGNIALEVCENGCGGIWFDNFELQKVDEPRESEGESLLEIPRNENISIDPSKKKKCPKCDDQQMIQHFFSVKRNVEVDECPSCAGIWLDCGELRTIRSQFNSDEERRKAADDYFSEIFGEDLAAMKAESEEKLEKAKKIAWFFRFICPTYYIKGDQEWGAF